MSRAETNRLGSGAPGSMVLGGETYLVAQPTEADMVTLYKHLSDAWKAESAGLLKRVASEVAGLPASVQEIAIRAVIESQAKGGADPSPSALQGMLFQPKRAAFWLWILIRKNHPAVKLSEIADAVNEDNVNEILATLLIASGMAEVAPNSTGATGSA